MFCLKSIFILANLSQHDLLCFLLFLHVTFFLDDMSTN